MEYRELDSEEKAQVPGMHPKALAIGAVEDGKVVAACGVLLAPHLDPLWVTPERRGRSGFALTRLWDAVKSRLLSYGATSVSATVTDGYPPPPYDKVIEHLAVSLAGGEEVKGRYWSIPLVDGENDTLGDEAE